MNSLFRITVGPTNSFGINIARKNIRMLLRLYPEVDIAVCYNKINPNFFSDLKVILVNQENYKDELFAVPKNEMWKLYPPRLRLNSHEIVMDNDIIIFKKVPEIDEFLISNKTLMFRGRNRIFGQYDNMVPLGYCINSGIYGLPPGYDFKSEIISLCGERQWKNWGDDQGVVAALLHKKEHLIIEEKVIMQYIPEWDFLPSSKIYGIHMIGANGMDIYRNKNFISKRKCANYNIVKQILVKL